MATSKTLTPTNVTIQIPEFTDQPDQRVNSNCIDKEADAINALNNNITPLTTSKAWSDFTKPTLSNGTHYGDGCHYIKIGCFVAVIISVQFDSAPSNALLWTMPSGYIPVGSVDISASGGGSYNAKAQCVINSSGGVRVTSVDKWVTGYGIYIVAT